MTNSQKLQNEINELMANMKKVKEENTVECNAPNTRKAYTYNKGVSLRSIA